MSQIPSALENDERLRANAKLALRRMAKSVTVISCAIGGTRYAMAATAVDALSMDPPSMIISVNRSASIYEPLAAGASFCVNVLSKAQEDIAIACGGAKKGEERFGLGEWDSAGNDTPVLQGAQANFICDHANSFSFGSHCVFIGRVIEVRQHGDLDPLVYIDGKYTTV